MQHGWLACWLRSNHESVRVPERAGQQFTLTDLALQTSFKDVKVCELPLDLLSMSYGTPAGRQTVQSSAASQCYLSEE